MRSLSGPVLLACALLLPALPSLAQTAPPRDIDYPGSVRLQVDASDLDRRVFRVRETLPVQPGPLTLLYPQWIPGNHRPSGQIEKLAGLVFSVNGKRLEWKRDPYDVYAFRLQIPEGATELVAEFQYLSPLTPAQGRVVMTPSMLNLQWNLTVLYPAGYYASRIPVDASVTLPAGWSYATALETATRSGDTVRFKPLDFANLQDSPLYAGQFYRQFDLDPGAKVPVRLNVFADQAKYLEAKPEQIERHRLLVEQAYKLYGARHYDHYDFLLALTEQLGGIGLEHHRSSENSARPGYFTEWDQQWVARDLLPHEFNHSWNGKFRRGADLATPSFNVPMGDSLLWLYEGQTQFFGSVLAARSGLWNETQAREMLANVAATYDRGRPGFAWRTLQDTTNDPTIAARRGLPYRNWQMSEDYYSGGQMLWLEVDAKLRELSGGKRSIDDFAKAFFGMEDGRWSVKPYEFDEIAATLNGIAAYDWAGLLRSRVDGHEALTRGIEASGWKLVYTDTPSDAFKAQEARGKSTLLMYSLGLAVGNDGDIGDVLWDGPAFKAGVAPGMKLVAVNGREFSGDALKEAVTAAKGGTAPIELLVKRFDRYDTFRIDYHDGLKYPSLQRIEGKPDNLARLYKPR